MFDGDEGVDDVSAQGGVDVLRQKRLAAGRRFHREVAHSLVGESCNKTSPLRRCPRRMNPNPNETSKSTIVENIDTIPE